MAKRKRGRPARRNGSAAGAQPGATEQAEGVTLSAADPRPGSAAGHNARLESLEAKVHQLCIKVGI